MRQAKRLVKQYHHFDKNISDEAAKNYVSDTQNVISHPFYPFIKYEKKFKKFTKKGVPIKPKVRPIRYAARLDGFIFKHYRSILIEKYEAELKRLNLSSNVLAYRKIPMNGNARGKSNIDFAKDAFDAVKAFKNCSTVCLDISSYYEHLDHEKIKEIWCRLLGVSRLPQDHFQVFKANTAYSYILKHNAMLALGYITETKDDKGNILVKYKMPYEDMNKQLTNGKEFREKIAQLVLDKNSKYYNQCQNLKNDKPENPNTSLKGKIIVQNKERYGIPQGSPISDLIANFYLIDFDTIMKDKLEKLGGIYYRYSDDILLIAPVNAEEAELLKQETITLIKEYGNMLEIQNKKCSIVRYFIENGEQKFEWIENKSNVDVKQGKEGLEYLGFRFDGKNVYLRNSTLANLHRKITIALKLEIENHRARYMGKSNEWLKENFNKDKFLSKFLKYNKSHYDKNKKRWVKKDEKEYKNWTFLTYAKKSIETFGKEGKVIKKQLRNLDSFVDEKFEEQY